MEKVLVTYANLFNRADYDVTVLNLTGDDSGVVSGFDKEIHYQNYYSPTKNFFHSSFPDMLRFNFRLLPWKQWIIVHTPQFLHKKYIKDQYDIEIAFHGIETTKIVGGGNKQKSNLIAWVHSTDENTFLPKGYSKKQAREIFLRVDKIICVSDMAKQKINEIFDRNKNVYVLNNPIDIVKIRELSLEKVSRPDKFTFINVSRLSDQSKGIFRLLDSCKRLVDEGKEFYLWLIGDGPDKDLIKKRIEHLGLTNVVLWGKQANPYKYMVAADAYICSSYYEGYSITIAEAVALGLVIVTTDVSGMRDMLGDSEYGLIVENSDLGIYAGMKRILDDRGLYDKYKAVLCNRFNSFQKNAEVQFIESINE